MQRSRADWPKFSEILPLCLPFSFFGTLFLLFSHHADVAFTLASA